MLNLQPPDQHPAEPRQDTWSTMRARPAGIGAQPTDQDDTRRIGPLTSGDSAAYDGSLSRSGQNLSGRTPEFEARAYFLTAEGGVLAEIPCRESAGIISIGRGQAASIRIDDPYVHRQQAEIRWDANLQAHFINHCGGENGTFVNGNRIERPFRLTGGESLRFGKTRLFYRIRR